MTDRRYGISCDDDLHGLGAGVCPERALKRWCLIKRALLAIVLGAATTVLVACGCALWISAADISLPRFFGPDFPGQLNISISEPSRLRGAARIVLYGGGEFNPSHDLEPKSVWIDRHIELEPNTTYVSDARGWPFLCVRGGFDIGSPDGRGFIVETHWAVVLDFLPQIPGRDKAATPILPLELIWSGFALNTLGYALVWWLLLTAPGVSRRAIRKSRGQCLGCGYDLRGMDHDVCPECGRVPKEQVHTHQSSIRARINIMKTLLKILASILLFIVAAACVFGFLASFEGDTSQFMIFRAFYAGVGGVSIIGAIWLVISACRAVRSVRL